MDILKQVEQKIQALVLQRDQLREELGRIKDKYAGHDAELRQLRSAAEEMQQQNVALVRERDEVRQQVESILKQLEALT